MLDRFERDTLREIEQQISATDPHFAALLRGTQLHLQPTRSRTGLRALIVLLVLLTGGLLALGLLDGAVTVATVAAVLWQLGRFCVIHLES